MGKINETVHELRERSCWTGAATMWCGVVFPSGGGRALGFFEYGPECGPCKVAKKAAKAAAKTRR
jgi:hypothetical protein